MMPDPLEVLLQSVLKRNQFSSTSRYHGIETVTYDTPDGSTVVYVGRRFLPSSDRFTVVQEHMVNEGERLDTLTAQYLGDPEQFWRICDANETMRPDELVEEPGRMVKIALPEGLSGPPNG